MMKWRYDVENIWIECLKNKYRFEFNGLLDVEDLFDLELEDLNSIYMKLKSQEKDLHIQSLIETSDNPKADEIAVKIKAVNAVFEYRKAEIMAERSIRQRVSRFIKRLF
jgi:uncharacterized protein YfkK (UPF0435 family)